MEGQIMLIRLMLTIIALFAALPAFAAERSYLIGSFDEIIVEGDMQVTLTTGQPPSAKATGDKERLNSLKIDRQGSVVRIRMSGLSGNRKVVEPVQIAMSGRNVRKLIVQGNGKITATDISTPQLRVEIRGSGEIDIANLKNDRLIGLLVGNGKLTLGKGTISDVELLIDGAPNVATSGVMVDKLRLQQNGPATTHFNVKMSAEITNSGSGNITVDGNATCFVRQAGGANIKCKKIG